MKLNKKETATILAALRYWQHNVDIDWIPHRFKEHFDDADPLNAKEIDLLCDKINFGESSKK